MSIESTLSAWTPSVLSVLRIVTGLEILQHGTAKILKFPAMPNFANTSITSMSGAAGAIELIAGALFLVGFFTRSAAFLLSGMCAVAYFYAHAAKSVYPIMNGGELAVLYCFVFFFFVFAGSGPLSVDALMRKR